MALGINYIVISTLKGFFFFKLWEIIFKDTFRKVY